MDRKAVFDAIRAGKGRIDPDDIPVIDDALDRIGFPKESEAQNPFDRALSVVLRHEGGYVNHPSDPGGRTNLGVTQSTWENWIGKPASEADMRALTIDKVRPLYKERYWDAVSGDGLPARLALCVFDFAVNAGPGRAARYLQKVAGVTQDGKIGPATLAAVASYVSAHGEPAAVRAYQDARRGYYKQLSTFATFGRGWLRRVDEVEAEALS